MAIEYIKEIFNNYSQVSIEDKKRLSERIIKIQNDDHAGNFYFSRHYELRDIDKVLDSMIKAKHFEEFYNSLNEEQKKEFQTRVYLTSTNKDISNYYSNLYEYIAQLVKHAEYKTIEYKNNFTIDFNKLEIALEEADVYDMSERVVAVYQNITALKESNLIIYEIVEVIKKCSSIIKEKVNDSTSSKIESLPLDRLVMTVLLLLDINKEQLNNDIEYRRKLKQSRDEFYIRKRENGIKEKLNSSKKIVKTRPNKYYISTMR